MGSTRVCDERFVFARYVRLSEYSWAGHIVVKWAGLLLPRRVLESLLFIYIYTYMFLQFLHRRKGLDCEIGKKNLHCSKYIHQLLQSGSLSFYVSNKMCILHMHITTMRVEKKLTDVQWRFTCVRLKNKNKHAKLFVLYKKESKLPALAVHTKHMQFFFSCFASYRRNATQPPHRFLNQHSGDRQQQMPTIGRDPINCVQLSLIWYRRVIFNAYDGTIIIFMTRFRRRACVDWYTYM